MKKILITGTAGFIGFHLVERLINEGIWDIVGLDNINDYYDVNLKYARLLESGINKEKIQYNSFVESEKSDKYRFIKMDLTDKDNILRLFEIEKFDYVINLAAQAGVRYSIENPYAYINSNIVGFMNILEGCRYHAVKHLVYASSSSVYGANTKIPFSEKDNVDHPISLYAATKKSNELMAHTYSYLYNLPTTGLRFFTVYGPWGRPDMALFIFTKKILAGEPIDVYNYGKMKRDFTYIDDIVDGIFRVIPKPPITDISWDSLTPDPSTSKAPFRIFNIGNNDPVHLNHFIDLIEKGLKKVVIKNYLSIQLGDVPDTYANIEKLIEWMDFKPNVSVEQGIENFIKWFLYYYQIEA